MNLNSPSTKEVRMALYSRQPLTTRQAYRRAIRETTGATHFVIKFSEDKAISLVSARNIVDPLPSSLKVFYECQVKWSDCKTYKATVLVMGKSMHVLNLSSILYITYSVLIHMYIVYIRI